jgi:methylase of polypeptide subunit release factors
VRTNHLALYVVAGIWLFFEAHIANPKLYFGDDSFALLNRLRPVKGGRTLDLCAGPGIQGLYCSRVAKSVTAVEINPLAAGLARVNCRLNDIDNLRVVVGDMVSSLPGETFDHIVCNPPLLPFPEDIDYPFVGHGGADGWKLVWRVLDGLPSRLSMEGRTQIIATCLSDGIVPSVAERLERWAKANNMVVLMPVISHQPLSSSHPYFQGLVQTTVTSTGRPYKEIAQRFAAHLEESRASHLCSHFLYVTRGSGALHLMDLSTGDTGSPQFWFA